TCYALDSTHIPYPLPILSFPFFFQCSRLLRDLHSFPTRRSSDLFLRFSASSRRKISGWLLFNNCPVTTSRLRAGCHSRRTSSSRSEEHTSELQSRFDLVCRLLLEKKKKNPTMSTSHSPVIDDGVS